VQAAFLEAAVRFGGLLGGQDVGDAGGGDAGVGQITEALEDGGVGGGGWPDDGVAADRAGSAGDGDGVAGVEVECQEGGLGSKGVEGNCGRLEWVEALGGAGDGGGGDGDIAGLGPPVRASREDECDDGIADSQPVVVAGAGLGCGDLDGLEDVGGAESEKADCSHAVSPRVRVGRVSPCRAGDSGRRRRPGCGRRRWSGRGE
jgi:hypothetical protein